MIIRIQLIVPENDFVSAGFFNQMLTMHGTTMIFLAGMPILVGLMNVAMPLQIGARDVSFPFLNALGFWLFMFGGILLNLSWFLRSEEHTSELQSRGHLVCRLLLEKKKYAYIRILYHYIYASFIQRNRS